VEEQDAGDEFDSDFGEDVSSLHSHPPLLSAYYICVVILAANSVHNFFPCFLV
jgi:hypothetical protein